MRPVISMVLVSTAFTIPPVLAQDDQPIIAAFSDYTVASKATKDVLSGRLKDGVFVIPDYQITSRTQLDTLRAIDQKINWKLSQITLVNSAPGSIACFDSTNPRTGDLNWSATLRFRDLTPHQAETIQTRANKLLVEKNQKLIFIISDPIATKWEVVEPTSNAQFDEAWKTIAEKPQQYRYIVGENLIWVSKTPDDASEKRRALIERHVSRCQPLAQSVASNPNAALSIAAYSASQDQFFIAAKAQGLSDDKLASYELLWQYEKAELGTSASKEMASKLLRFQDDLSAAATNTKCTLTVHTSNGQKADVVYKKPADKDFTILGESIVTTEIERATYLFQCWRQGKKTGETMQAVDCTGKSQTLTITEK